MCGLSGFSGVTGQEERLKLVVGLGSGIDNRGGHASGYISINKHSVKFCKKLGKWMKAKQRFINTAAEGDACMMHARYATCGNRENVEEAHPYAIKRNGQIVLWGAHNGMIPDAFKCAEKHGRKVAVDSQEIFELIADREYKTLNDLSGYGVVTWVEADERDTINLVKLSNNGDIVVVKLKEGGIVWASTWYILNEALKLAGLTAVSKYDNFEVGRVYQIKDGEVYSTGVTGIKTSELWRSRSYGHAWRGEFADDNDEGWSAHRSSSSSSSNSSSSASSSSPSSKALTTTDNGSRTAFSHRYGADVGYSAPFDGRIERVSGNVEWYKDRVLHREDGPAVEKKNGDKEWWFKGKLHRDNGPAVEKEDGEKEWFLHGVKHREDGPAWVKKNGDCQYYYKGKLHRLDGPAITFKHIDASKAPPWTGYYVAGNYYHKKDAWEEAVKAFKALQASVKEEIKKEENTNVISSKLDEELASLDKKEQEELEASMNQDHAFLRELNLLWNKWEESEGDADPEQTRFLTRGIQS